MLGLGNFKIKKDILKYEQDEQKQVLQAFTYFRV